MMLARFSLLLLLLSASPATSLSPISAKGTKLYDNAGNQFFVKGVAYIAGNGTSDPLADARQCQADAALMKDLGINTVYVYGADTAQDHDGCMAALAEQGIYVWLQLGDFPRATDAPPDSPLWTLSVFAAWTEVMDAFAGYDNLLAFGIGQETITENATSTLAAPSLKAAARDLRAFRAARGYRPIPLSYSAADVGALLLPTAQYLACAGEGTAGDEKDDPSSTATATTTAAASIELLGLNIFSRCAPADWTALASQFSASSSADDGGSGGGSGDRPAAPLLPIPVVISETGCRGSPREGDRNFSDVAFVLGGDGQAADDVFSGVNVFEWALRDASAAAASFGIVWYADGGAAGERAAPLAQFSTLRDVLAAAKPAGTPAAEYDAAGLAPPPCPTKDAAAGWLVDAAAPLPSIEGLDIGTVTARTGSDGSTTAVPTGGGGGGGSSAATDRPSSEVEEAGETVSQLSAGAIAGIAVGSLVGLLALGAGVCLWLRRRRRTLRGGGVQDPASAYPENKVELPAQNWAAIEMDGSPHSPASSASGWKMPVQGARHDSPTVAELPGRPRRETIRYELENSPVGSHGTSVGASPGTWSIPPPSPMEKARGDYV